MILSLHLLLFEITYKLTVIQLEEISIGFVLLLINVLYLLNFVPNKIITIGVNITPNSLYCN